MLISSKISIKNTASSSSMITCCFVWGVEIFLRFIGLIEDLKK